MKQVRTQVFEFPKWKTNLFISLFNTDGGDGFEESEIIEANAFIKEHRLQTLVSIDESYGDHCKCTFICDDPPEEPTEHIYVLVGEKAISDYEEYGLLPLQATVRADRMAFFKSFSTEQEKERLISMIRIKAPVIVDNLDNKMKVWWCSLPENLKLSFSVLPWPGKFWDKLDIITRITIYNYCIIKENGLSISKGVELDLISEMVNVLAQMALGFLYDKSIEEMEDEAGTMKEKYRGEFNRLYNEIESTVTSIIFN